MNETDSGVPSSRRWIRWLAIGTAIVIAIFLLRFAVQPRPGEVDVARDAMFQYADLPVGQWTAAEEEFIGAPDVDDLVDLSSFGIPECNGTADDVNVLEGVVAGYARSWSGGISEAQDSSAIILSAVVAFESEAAATAAFDVGDLAPDQAMDARCIDLLNEEFGETVFSDVAYPNLPAGPPGAMGTSFNFTFALGGEEVGISSVAYSFQRGQYVALYQGFEIGVATLNHQALASRLDALLAEAIE